jgi:hypothetical protein
MNNTDKFFVVVIFMLFSLTTAIPALGINNMSGQVRTFSMDTSPSVRPLPTTRPATRATHRPRYGRRSSTLLRQIRSMGVRSLETLNFLMIHLQEFVILSDMHTQSLGQSMSFLVVMLI